MPNITAVLPVYNIAPYIEKCLNSLEQQTFTDFEIICVNDCSTDNSAELIEKYTQKDSRFKLVHNEVNSGVSYSRNKGIDLAQGEYLIFIDPDDWVDITLFEKVNNAFSQYNVDSVWYSLYRYENENKTKKNIFENHEILKKSGLYEITADNIHKFPNFVNKAYKTSKIRELDLKFPVGLVFEDSEFYFKCFTQIKEIYYINECLYYYWVRPESTVNSAKKGDITMKDSFEVYLNIHNYCVEKGILSEYKNALCYQIITRIKNRSIEGQNEFILRKSDELLNKINFPECFSIEN